MSAKRKLVVAMISIACVVFGLVATVSIVFAMTDQTIISSLNVDYTAVDIDGSVEATVFVGVNDEGTPLTPNGTRVDGNKLIFKAADKENAGSLTFPTGLPDLTEENQYTMVIKYTYTNTGDRHYIASLAFDSEETNENMTIEHGIIKDSTVSTEIEYEEGVNYAIVVQAGATRSYWVRITVNDAAYDAHYSADFNWNLVGCDPQDKEYLSLSALDYFEGDDETNSYSATYGGGYIPNGELIIPSEVNGYEVTSVTANPKLTTEKSLIKSVTIPASVQSIDDNTFNGFSNLEEVIFEQNSSAEVASVQSTSTGLKTIGNSAFANCPKLDNFAMPSTVTSIGANAFDKCYNLKDIVVPDGVSIINDSTFNECVGLVNVTLPEGIISVGNSAFNGCSELVNLTLPLAVESVGEYAFSGCVRLTGEPDLHNVTTIGASAFADCSSLTKVYVGAGVTSLESSTFSNCENVLKYYLTSHSAITALSNTEVFSNMNENCKIYVIETLYDAYVNDTNWSMYSDKFAKIGYTTDGVCEDSLEEPIIDMHIKGNSVQRNLPSEYQQVEYLQSSGTQYIIIDYIASGITSTKAKFQITDISKASFLFGSRETGGKNFYGFNWGGSAKPYKYYNSYVNGYLTSIEIDTEIHTIYKERGKLYLDNIIVYTVSDSSFTTPSDMNIFACYSDSDGYLPTYAKLFSLQFYDNDKLVVDLIPCYRIVDNVAGLYDKVNEVFYTNNGTGEFIVGENVVEPTPETPVEIQSAGEKTKNLFDEKVLLESANAEKIEGGYLLKYYPVTYSTSSTLVTNLKKTLKPNTTYTLSRKLGNYTKGNEGSIWIRNGAGEVVVNVPYGLGIKFSTFSLTQEQIDSIYNVYIYGRQGDTPILYEYIQLEEGETATEYEPYGKYKIPVKVNGTITNIFLDEPLRKVGDYADYIDVRNKKVVRKVFTYNFTGKESTVKLGFSEEGVKYGYEISTAPSSQVKFVNGQMPICNYLSGVKTSVGFVNIPVNHIRFHEYQTHFNIVVSHCSTVTELREWLSALYDEGKPLTYYYPMATPIEQEIEIPDFKTFEGTTTFEVLTEIQPSEIMVKYHK